MRHFAGRKVWLGGCFWLSGLYIRNALTVISHLYAVAASEWEGLAGLANPVEGLRRPKHRPGRERRLEGPKEEARLLKGCDACGNPSLRPVVLWALETAMRQGEILGLRRSDIRGSIARVADSKNGHSRAVALSSRAQALIGKRAGDPDSSLFPIGQDSLEYYWRKACGLAKVRDLHFHDLRHEAVSRLFEKGLTTDVNGALNLTRG